MIEWSDYSTLLKLKLKKKKNSKITWIFVFHFWLITKTIDNQVNSFLCEQLSFKV